MQRLKCFAFFASLLLIAAANEVSKQSTLEDKFEGSKDEHATSISITNSSNFTRNDDDSDNNTVTGEVSKDKNNDGLVDIECPNALEKFITMTTSFQIKLIPFLSTKFSEKSVCASGLVTVLLTGSLYLYSEKKTFKELSSSMGFKDKDEARCVFKAIGDYIYPVLAGSFVPGLAVFANVQYPLTDEFISDAETYINADAKNFDFEEKQASSSDIINEWISKRTNQEVSNVITTFRLPENDIQIGFASGILLSPRWLYGFDPELKRRTFYVSSSFRVRTNFMSQVAPYMYYESRELDAKIIKMPFQRKDLAIILVLPNRRYEDIAEFARKFDDPGDFNTAVEKMTEYLVRVEISPMNITNYIDTVPLLKEAWFATAILNKNTINLSGAIVGDEKAALTYGNQKATIITSVKGGLIPDVRIRRKANFRADHPFLFFVTCLTFKGMVLMSGAVVNPEVTIAL